MSTIEQQFEEHLKDRLRESNVEVTYDRSLIADGLYLGTVVWHDNVIPEILSGYSGYNEITEILSLNPLILTRSEGRDYIVELTNACDVGGPYYWVRFIPLLIPRKSSRNHVFSELANTYVSIYCKSDITDF